MRKKRLQSLNDSNISRSYNTARSGWKVIMHPLTLTLKGETTYTEWCTDKSCTTAQVSLTTRGLRTSEAPSCTAAVTASALCGMLGVAASENARLAWSSRRVALCTLSRHVGEWSSKAGIHGQGEGGCLQLEARLKEVQPIRCGPSMAENCTSVGGSSSTGTI